MELKRDYHLLIRLKKTLVRPEGVINEVEVMLLTETNVKLNWLTGPDSPYQGWMALVDFYEVYDIVEIFTTKVDHNGTHISTITT